MSGAPGRREVAHRVFASEFDDATYTFTRGDEDRAPKYVVSPTGALMNRVFVVGVLTEVDAINEETVRARIADPTGAFVIYASQYQPDARAALRDLASPAFVAVTGKANTFVPDGGDRTFTSIRPEAVAAVDAQTRDHWIVTTAERTIERLGRIARALENDDADPDEGVTRAIEEYALTPAYLSALYAQSLEALEVVADEREQVTTEVRLGTDGSAEYALSTISAAGEAMSQPTPDREPEPVKQAPTDAPEATSEPPSEPEEIDSVTPAPPEEDVVPDDEREAIEDEFGTEFATGDEVDSPATAEPEPPSVDEDVTDPPAEEASEDEPALSDRLVDLLAELDTGEGVPRDELIAAGRDRFDATEEDLAAAVREAMMDGHCYEPAEDVLRPI